MIKTQLELPIWKWDLGGSSHHIVKLDDPILKWDLGGLYHHMDRLDKVGEKNYKEEANKMAETLLEELETYFLIGWISHSLGK